MADDYIDLLHDTIRAHQNTALIIAFLLLLVGMIILIQCSIEDETDKP